MKHKDPSWEKTIVSPEISPIQYRMELEKGTFSPDSGRLNSPPLFKNFANVNFMNNLDYDMREVKNRLDVFYSDNADLKAEIKVSNVNTKHIMDDINKLTHSTETNTSNITDIKNTFSEFKSESKLEFEKIRAESKSEFEKVRTESKSEFEKVKTETASQFVDIKNQIALNLEKTKTSISESEIKFGDKLRAHMIWTISVFFLITIAAATLNYRNNNQLENKFNKLEANVTTSISDINGKLDKLIANQSNISSGTTALNKSDPIISITKTQMQAVIVEAIQEAEKSRLDNDIAMLDIPKNNTQKKAQ